MPTIQNIVAHLRAESRVRFNHVSIDAFITGAKPIGDAGPEDISFLGAKSKNAAALLANSRAGLVIVDERIAPTDAALQASSVGAVVTSFDPRLDFIYVLQKFFAPPPPKGIHPTAVIHPDAKIHPDVFIGPYTCVGNCFIDKDAVIYGHVHLYDKTRIGQRVIIHAGTVIGADGFGYQKDEEGEWIKFPHLGGVVLEDDVEIGANVCIDRGALGDTTIREGAKIDNLVHIAHNVVIGRRAMVIAHAMVAGSTRIGDGTWVAPCAAFVEKLTIGADAKIGMGAVVTRNIKDGQTVFAEPARVLKDRAQDKPT